MAGAIYDSRIGPLTVVVNDDDGALEAIYFEVRGEFLRDEARCAEAVRQLDEYFHGSRTRFELKLAPKGTEFQRAVWHALEEVPYGQTVTYGEIARRIGKPSAVRAVGAANGANPIPIVVPCHRVVGADGTLTGYGGGLDIKRALLTIEHPQRAL